jgi:hypothetical protein
MKDGYRFPDNATTAPKSISDIAGIDNSMEGLKARLTATPVSELGPVSAGTDASLLAPPQMSPVIIEGQGITSSQAINPVSGRPYVKSSIPKKIVEEKSYIEQLLDNAKTQVKEGFKDFKDKPMTTIFGEDPIATASDRFSGQLTQALAQRAAMGKPEGATVYYADIADFGQAYTAPYDSAEINDRAMQIQFGGADIFQQLPYGAGANVWQQQFRQSLGGRG